MKGKSKRCIQPKNQKTIRPSKDGQGMAFCTLLTFSNFHDSQRSLCAQHRHFYSALAVTSNESRAYLRDYRGWSACSSNSIANTCATTWYLHIARETVEKLPNTWRWVWSKHGKTFVTLQRKIVHALRKNQHVVLKSLIFCNILYFGARCLQNKPPHAIVVENQSVNLAKTQKSSKI